MLTGLFPGTSTAAAKSDDSRSVDRLSVPKTHIFLPVILKDPAPIIPVQPSHETFSVDWGGGKIQALGGRMALDFPQGAVNYPNCTLHIETPDQNASWLEFNFYILCQLNPGEDPYNFYQFNFPVTISIDYSKVSTAFLDESRLIISSGSVSNALEQTATTENAGMLSSNLPISNIVVDTTNKIVSGQTLYAEPLQLSRGYYDHRPGERTVRDRLCRRRSDRLSGQRLRRAIHVCRPHQLGPGPGAGIRVQPSGRGSGRRQGLSDHVVSDQPGFEKSRDGGGEYPNCALCRSSRRGSLEFGL